LYVDDSPVFTSPASMDKTGGVAIWSTYNFTTSNILAGTHTLKLHFSEGGPYIDNMTFGLQPTALNNVNENSNLSIYPNPTYDYLNISGVESDNPTFKVAIYSVEGTMVKQITFTNGFTPIFVGDLSKGIYLVRISEDEKTIKNLKLIKN